MSPGKGPKLLLKDINSLLTCTLCNGYFIDATTFDCLHSFCRSCILNHFETSKQQMCPTCEKKKTFFKPDHQLQALVYKMVPGLFCKETQRREDFYRSSVRGSSICSDDSVLGELRQDQDKWVSTQGYQDNYFSPEDPISLSLEFYQSHLDDTDETKEFSRKLCSVAIITKRTQSTSLREKLTESECDNKTSDTNIIDKVKGDRRYLQCPAAVSMTHLQKFLRMKYALSSEHRVDIIYEGEVLPLHYTLMDVAYTFNWTKLKPMRFFYRIFTPLKVQPIKIINTSSSNGSKQLQIVPVRPNADVTDVEKSKEQFVAQLKLQSKHKTQTQNQTQSHTLTTQQNQSRLNDENCVYEYEEPDKEEIKKFAESRDREWARMRHDDLEPSSHHAKKRKKNKHSKGDVKKPKIHAEITSEVKQESIKLKVKLTPAHNGHKHKHRTSQIVDAPKESSSLQLQKPREQQLQTDVVDVKPKAEPVKKLNEIVVKKADTVPKTTDVNHCRIEGPSVKKDTKVVSADVKKDTKPVVAKSATTLVEVQPKPDNSQQKLQQQQQFQKQQLQEAVKRKFEEQKAFLKPFHVSANARQSPVQKVQSVKVEPKKPLNTYSNQTKQNVDKKNAALQQLQKSQQQKPNQVQPQKVINNQASQQQQQQQRQKVKPQNDTQTKDKKVSFASEKPHILNSQQYQCAFTVSKVEQGVKRKTEDDGNGDKDKRPSLEITLVNPNSPKPQQINTQQRQNPQSVPSSETPKAKRPPPATIPLDRIKKSVKSGVSIIPKMDSFSGALDLTKKIEPIKTNGMTTLNGIKTINGKLFEKNSLSNLQLLSKVASAHSMQNNNNSTNNNNKVRPPIPNVPAPRIPVPNQSQSPRSTPNLANLPKLNEINKSTFKMVSGNHNNNNVRNVVQRANAQNVTRSIPNPSLLVRQHNQNRLTLNGQNGQTGLNSQKGQNGSNNKSISTSSSNGTGNTGGGANNSNDSNTKDQPKILNILAKENTINKDLKVSNGNSTANSSNNSVGNNKETTPTQSVNIKINNSNQVLDEREKNKGETQNDSVTKPTTSAAT